MRFVATCLLLTLLAAELAAQPAPLPPQLEVDDQESLILTALPPILANDEIAKHLSKGLTTTFDFRRVEGDEATPVARIEIRFEPWDEIYECRVLDLGGPGTRTVARSFVELEKFWRELRLLVGKGRPSMPNLRFEVAFLPFSQAEQNDTQRWFSESLGRTVGGSAEGAARISQDGGQPLSQALHLLMSTSIKRRAVLVFEWTLLWRVAPTGPKK